MDKLARWLRDQRYQSKQDVRELSSRSSVTTAQISRIENNLSGITLNTLVGLGYGLGFGLTEVLGELKIYPHFPRLKSKKTKKYLSVPIPRIDDASAIWFLFRDEAQNAKTLMYEGYRQVQEKQQSDGNEDIANSFDAVWEAFQAHSNRFVRLSYPTTMTLDHSAEIYSNEGVITNRDLGLRLKNTRVEKDWSQRDLADKTEISHSVISRLENGNIERVLFDNIIRLDKALVMDGELISLSWAAGEYESSVSLLNYLSEKNSEKQKYNYVEWEPVSKAWADTFIVISRWHYLYKLPLTWWSSIQREIGFYKK